VPCQVLLPPFGLGASLRRIGALVRRYMYLLRSSGIRLVELIYWPFPADAHLGVFCRNTSPAQRVR
jgi:hypothetical protein